MRKQATRANPAQIAQHIRRQHAGLQGMEFAQAHPVIDALLGGAVLLVGLGSLIGYWAAVGAAA